MFTSSTHRLPARPALLLLALSIGMFVAGCQRAGGESTQLAAKVNDGEISLSQLQQALQRQPAAAPDRADAQARRALETIIQQELAAQGARSQGLDRDPRVVQAIEAAKREVLAKAYQDALADKATLPSSDEVDRYYDSQPALFSQRRFYALQEIAVEGSADQLLAVRDRIEAATDAKRPTDILRDARLRFAMRQLTVAPEDVPLPLLDRLAGLQDGQSLMVPQPGGARVLTLMSSTPAALGRDAARPAIQAFLVNERKGQAIQEGMKALRDAARIEYKGRFAPPKTGPAASAASAPEAR